MPALSWAVCARQARILRMLAAMSSSAQNSDWAAMPRMGCPAFSGQLIGAISCCELPVQVLVVDFLRSLIAEC
jgi:hypothetical protein